MDKKKKKKNITTPDNIKFGDLPAETRMKILQMHEEAREEATKKRLLRLYNNSNMN